MRERSAMVSRTRLVTGPSRTSASIKGLVSRRPLELVTTTIRSTGVRTTVKRVGVGSIQRQVQLGDQSFVRGRVQLVADHAQGRGAGSGVDLHLDPPNAPARERQRTPSSRSAAVDGPSLRFSPVEVPWPISDVGRSNRKWAGPLTAVKGVSLSNAGAGGSREPEGKPGRQSPARPGRR